MTPTTLSPAGPTKLHLGCGGRYLEGFLNVDADQSVRADVYADLNRLPWPIASDSMDEIVCNQVFEHLSVSMIDFLRECHRILKPDGVAHIETPNAFFWRNRVGFLFGRADGSYWAPFHTKFVHPAWLLETAKVLGFDAKVKKHGWIFLPLSWSEQNLVFDARKRR